MSFWDELTQGIANAADDIRHQVVEEPYFGRQVTGDIELKESEPPAAQQGKWEELTQDVGTVPPAAPEMEMER